MTLKYLNESICEIISKKMEDYYTYVLGIWLNIWESFLGIVEPHLPEYLHWNELCVSKYSIVFFRL